MISKLVLSNMLALAVAQQEYTTTFPYVYGDASSIVASVVTAHNDATTFALGCPPASLDCGLFPKHTLVVGPSTYNVDMSDPNTDFTATQDCVIASSSAVCMETAGGSEANFPGSSTETYERTDIGKWTLTITAGTEKLVHTDSVVQSSPTAASQSVTQGSSTASITPTPGSGSATASSSASRTGTAPAQPSTAGAAVNVMVCGGGFVGAAAGVFGGLLL